ncbi:MAG: hypothetical protein IT492_10705 [Gammaproteobacteria bacterium]|nr:hypothetical protein [Gammaproteobacteria bacterium]
MSRKIDTEQVVARMRETQERAVAWAARQAIGDAVLILLRTQELCRDALLQQLQRMADGTDREWTGVRDAATKGHEFILAPPPELPSGLPPK